MAEKIRLTFTDGRAEEVSLNVACLVAAERKYGENMPRIEGTLFAAWHRLGRPGSFDDWIEQVDGIEEPEGKSEGFDQGPPDGS